MSLPVRGEWIEIVLFTWNRDKAARSLPVRGEWIEMDFITNATELITGLSP